MNGNLCISGSRYFNYTIIDNTSITQLYHCDFDNLKYLYSPYERLCSSWLLDNSNPWWFETFIGPLPFLNYQNFTVISYIIFLTAWKKKIISCLNKHRSYTKNIHCSRYTTQRPESLTKKNDSHNTLEPSKIISAAQAVTCIFLPIDFSSPAAYRLWCPRQSVHTKRPFLPRSVGPGRCERFRRCGFSRGELILERLNLKTLQTVDSARQLVVCTGVSITFLVMILYWFLREADFSGCSFRYGI